MIPSPFGALGGAEPPPFSLPGSHFAAGAGFLVLAALGLASAAPDLAAGSFLAPRVTGVTHLFTLGWITTSIMGALYQLLPVALDRSVRWPRVARATLWLHVPGLLAFVAGLMAQRPGLTVVGASLLATGLMAFIANLAATLKSAPRRDMTWWALALAACFLFLTVAVGWALAANLRWPYMGAFRIAALATHIHVALVGWVLLVMVGVAQKLLPMFLLSHGADERPGKWAVGLLASGTLLLFALHHTGGAWARWVPATLILAGAASFLAQARAFYATRRRPVVDPGMRLAAAGLGVLGAAAGLGAFLAFAGFSPQLATGYVTALVLGISLFVAAHYYKIVPFLVWYHRFGPLAGRQPVPKVAELYAAGWAKVAGVLLTAGTVTVVLAVLAGSAPAARAGALVFLAGALVEAAQMAGVARRRPAGRPQRSGPRSGRSSTPRWAWTSSASDWSTAWRWTPGP